MASMTLRRVAIRCTSLALVLVAAMASPAAAHGTAEVPAGDYSTEVSAVAPPVEGLHARAVDEGVAIELRNESSHEVTVLGYDGEPYLRVGPDGVFRNERSPATFWNTQANRNTTELPPPSYDATKAPTWHRISDGTVARWRDHRAHYVGGSSGGAARVVLAWTIPLRDGDRDISIAGTVRYLPPPSPAPYLLFAALLAFALVVAGRTRVWPVVLTGSLAVLVVAAGAQIVGEWGATTLPFASRVGEHVYVFAGVALGIGACTWTITRRSRPYDATPIALLAGVALLLASGLSGIPFLAHEVIPTTFPNAFVRILVAVTIGVGLATVVIAATRLRQPFAPRPAANQESSTATEILRSMYAEK
jgi:hypothetical protein